MGDTYGDGPTCPHCGRQDSGSDAIADWGNDIESEREVDCYGCDRTFLCRASISITFISRAKPEGTGDTDA